MCVPLVLTSNLLFVCFKFVSSVGGITEFKFKIRNLRLISCYFLALFLWNCSPADLQAPEECEIIRLKKNETSVAGVTVVFWVNNLRFLNRSLIFCLVSLLLTNKRWRCDGELVSPPSSHRLSVCLPPFLPCCTDDDQQRRDEGTKQTKWKIFLSVFACWRLSFSLIFIVAVGPPPWRRRCSPFEANSCDFFFGLFLRGRDFCLFSGVFPKDRFALKAVFSPSGFQINLSGAPPSKTTLFSSDSRVWGKPDLWPSLTHPDRCCRAVRAINLFSTFFTESVWLLIIVNRFTETGNLSGKCGLRLLNLRLYWNDLELISNF